jgi:hypothetical protein
MEDLPKVKDAPDIARAIEEVGSKTPSPPDPFGPRSGRTETDSPILSPLAPGSVGIP